MTARLCSGSGADVSFEPARFHQAHRCPSCGGVVWPKFSQPSIGHATLDDHVAVPAYLARPLEGSAA